MKTKGVLGLFFLIFILGCEGLVDAVTDPDPEETDAPNGVEEIQYGEVAGSWVEVGPEVSVSSQNPDFDYLWRNSLLIYDGRAYVAAVNSTLGREETDDQFGIDDQLGRHDPALFVFEMDVDGSEWIGEEDPIVVLDSENEKHFGDIDLAQMGGIITATYAELDYGDSSAGLVSSEIRSVFLDETSATNQTVSDLEIDGIDHLRSWTDSAGERFLAVSGGDNIAIFRSRLGTSNGSNQLGFEETVFTGSDGIEEFEGSLGSRRQVPRVDRQWDVIQSQSNYILLGTRQGEIDLRVWRMRVTDDSWGLRSSIEFNTEDLGFFSIMGTPITEGLTVHNVRAVPDGTGGAYVAVVYENSDPGTTTPTRRSGRVFRLSGSGPGRINQIETVGPRFFGATQLILDSDLGTTLEIYVTPRNTPLVVWGEGGVQAAEFFDGQWSQYGGVGSSRPSGTRQASRPSNPVSVDYDRDSDTLYVLSERQLYRFDKD